MSWCVASVPNAAQASAKLRLIAADGEALPAIFCDRLLKAAPSAARPFECEPILAANM